MADLFVSDSGTDKFYRWTGETTTINNSFSFGGIENFARDCDWDGTNIHSTGTGGDKQYQHSGWTGTVTDSFTVPNSNRGCSWDGTDAYDNSATGTDKWFRRTGFTATVAASFTGSGFNVASITWDVENGDLLESNFSAKNRQRDGFSSTITASYDAIPVIALTAKGDGDTIECRNGGTKVRRRAIFTSTILASWSPAEFSSRRGVAWDGRFAAIPPSTAIRDIIGMGIIPFLRL